MVSTLLACFWLSMAVCASLVVAKHIFDFDTSEFLVLKWSAFQNSLKQVSTKLNARFELPSEEEHLASLIDSIKMIDEKLAPVVKLAREKVANNIVVQAQIGRALEKSRQEVIRWHETAKKHLDEKNEELAREALSRKLHFQMEAEVFAELMEEDKQELELLTANLAAVEKITMEASQQSKQLIYRAKSADAAIKTRRKFAVVNRRILFSHFDTDLIHLKHANGKSSATISSAINGVTDLLRTVEDEVETMEDNVLNYRDSQDKNNSQPRKEAIQQAFDELKKSVSDDNF